MSDSSSEQCPTCGAALSVDRMGAYCPSCKHAIGEWRTEESSPLIAAVARLSAENEKLRAENAAMREIVEAMADAGPMIPPFDQYDGAIMERFITKARALLAKDEERDK